MGGEEQSGADVKIEDIMRSADAVRPDTLAREALRVMAPSFQPGWDVLIIARPALVEADHDALVEALRRLLGRSGVIGGPSTT